MDTRLFDNLLGAKHDYHAGSYMLHGDESREAFIWHLDAMEQLNIRTFCFESRIHPDYCGPRYWEDMEFLLNECKQRGLHAWLMDDLHCPSGNANDRFLTNPEYADQLPWEIRETHVDVCGPVTGGHVMSQCWLEHESERILAIVACKHVPDSHLLSGETVDLTANQHDGLVSFDLGEGVWRIFFLIQTRQNVLPFCDKLRASSTDVYIKEVYEPLYAHLKKYFGNTLLGFFNDEPAFHNNHTMSYITDTGTECAQYPWGDWLLEGLRERYGSQMWGALVGLWYEYAGQLSQELRVVYMDLLSQAYYKNYIARLAHWCHSHGIRLMGHILEDNHAHAKTGYGCGHFFRAIGDMDMSGIDNVLHQLIPGMTQCSHRACSTFRHGNNEFYHYYLAKLGASFAHVDPRKHGITMCEIFGAYGYAEGTRMMKYIADHMLVRGANYFVTSSFAATEGALDCPPMHVAGGKNPLFPYTSDIMEYMNRVAYLLSDGVHVSSCAIFYDAHAIWANGEHLPGEKVAKVLYDNHFDYDILPLEYVTQIDAQGYLNGEKYSLLLLPYCDYLPPEVIAGLRNSNVEVLCVGGPGQVSPDFPTVAPEQLPGILAERSLQDVATDYSGIFLRSYHYVRGGTHIYMFTNEDPNNTIRANVTLSAFSGGTYAIYDAMANTACRASSPDGTVPLELPPYGSIMILCGELEYAQLLPQQKYELVQEQPLDVQYTVSLSRENGPYEPYGTTRTLYNATGPDHDPRFSGSIRYEAVCTLPQGQRTVLDLGSVGEAAQVYINGRFAGARLSPPYCYDLTGLTVEGENLLEITVSNHLGYSRWDLRSQYLLFEPSGLLGPVTVKTYRADNEADICLE